jgi:hypothetical protein
MSSAEEPPLIPPDDAAFEAAIAAPAATADPGPPPSSDAPGAVQEPPAQSGSENAAQYQPAEFDERYKVPFTGLMYLGRLEETVAIWGHTFRLVTPSRMERLQAGELHAPYVGTLSAELAYETVLVAAFLSDVDGQPLPRPVVNDPKENAVRDRFRWVAENLKEPVMSRVYEYVLLLDQKVRDVMEAMGEA